MSISDMIAGERPLSEQYRIVAKQWVDAHAAAELLEETKSANLAEMILNYKAEQGEPVPHNQAETAVKASADWKEFVAEMVEARRMANRYKVQMEYIRMKFSEWQSLNANARQERQLSR